MALGSPRDEAGGPVVTSITGRTPRGGRDGFTLVEILVALAIFSVVMTGVFGLLLLQQRAFARQGDLEEARRNLRRGIDLIERELHRAGYGLPSGAAVRLPAGMTGDAPLLLVSGLGLVSGEADSSDLFFVAHSPLRPDRLARRMATASSALAVDGTIPWKAGDIAMIADGTHADLFRVSRVDGGEVLHHGRAGVFDGQLSKAYGEGSRVVRVTLAGYAVSSADEGAFPALVRRVADPEGNPGSHIVVEGIEEMRVRQSAREGVRVRLVARSRFATGDSGPRTMEAVVGLRNAGDAP